jgi:hypothetical protein
MNRKYVFVEVRAEFLFSVEISVRHQRRDISPLFCKKRTARNISVLQEEQKGYSVLHMTDALRGEVSPLRPILVILEDAAVIYLHVVADH